jgi:hypothetical protein
VKFRGGGRDQTVFEEAGRKVKIYTELLTGKTSRAMRGYIAEQAGKAQQKEPRRVRFGYGGNSVSVGFGSITAGYRNRKARIRTDG